MRSILYFMFQCFAEYAFYDKFRLGFVLPTIRVTVDQYEPKKIYANYSRFRRLKQNKV